MGLGLTFLNLETTLLIHAIGAPIFFIVLSLIYFRKFSYTGPLTTAAIFIGFVILVDFFIVALMVNKSLDMFQCFPGTWLPFILIFCATWITGSVVMRSKRRSQKDVTSRRKAARWRGGTAAVYTKTAPADDTKITPTGRRRRVKNSS